MTPAEFKLKWAKFSGKESAAYQEHFSDICRMLGVPTPLQADPSGNDFFCFQKRVMKDAELFVVRETGEEEADPEERGFADVWKKGCFCWEYKGKKKNLDEAYKQLLRYRESLLNPPLLVVCDFDRFIIRTNFNGTVQETYEFTNAEIDRPENLRTLRAVYDDPDFLKPLRTTTQVTENLAETIAEVAKSLQKREAVEYADAQTRAELNFAQRKNLRIARFLNRIVFCFFAEDTGLLPKNLFGDLLRAGVVDLAHFARTLENLFSVMAKGGAFGKDKIRHFNGHLFEESTVFELTEEELRKLADAGEADWQFIQPSIMGTLFERALEPEQRSQLGAHYTSEDDIKTLVEPVLMTPLRREWASLKGELADAYVKGTPAQRDKLAAFQKKLTTVRVLDPACGSGNFLYVSLQLLLALEKEVVTFATQLGFKLMPQVSVQQLLAIEINPYAYELAQVSVQIGFLQWRRDNGFDNDRSPVLQNLDGFQNEDALLVPHFRSKAKTLTAAQAGEHAGDNALKFYTEREWPKCDVIVSNPPFLGGSRLWDELGREYQQELWRVYKDRVPGFADLCCYWFEKARQQIKTAKCKRAGLLATQAIRGGANREVLNRIKETGDIFFAESDRDWVLNGAMVHVSMVGFDNGEEPCRQLDGLKVATINANLTSTEDVTKASILAANRELSFIGTKKAGKFELDDDTALKILADPNPTGKPNSDLIRPWLDGYAVAKRVSFEWIIDCGLDLPLESFVGYVQPHKRVLAMVKPDRDENNRKLYREKWWLHAETRPSLRRKCLSKGRYLATVRHSKHRIFVWADGIFIPDDGVFAFAREDDFFFGLLHSRFHEKWARAQGTQVREKESGFRYTPTTCFETFPFPFPDDLEAMPDNLEAELDAAKHYKHIVLREEPPPQTPDEHIAAIAAAAKELNDLRERWLNPPEWTQTRVLEFPGTIGGPWDRYIEQSRIQNPESKIGLVRYPRLEPRDAECAANLKKRTLTNLYNERPAWLDMAHKKLDAAVATAYGWPADLPDDEILTRLLALNLERATEEARATVQTKPKTQRAKAAEEML